MNIIQLETSKPVGFRYDEPGFGFESRPSNGFYGIVNEEFNGTQSPSSGYIITPEGIVAKPILNLSVYPMADEAGSEAHVMQQTLLEYEEDYAIWEVGDNIGYKGAYSQFDVSPLTSFTGAVEDTSSIRVIHCRQYAQPNADGGPRVKLKTWAGTDFYENQGLFFAYCNLSTNAVRYPEGGSSGDIPADELNILRNTDFKIIISDKSKYTEEEADSRRAEFWFLNAVNRIRVVLYNWDGNKVYDKLLDPVTKDAREPDSTIVDDGGNWRGVGASWEVPLGNCYRLGIFPLYKNICIYVENGDGSESKRPNIYMVDLEELEEIWWAWGTLTDPVNGGELSYPIMFKEGSTTHLQFRLYKGWFAINRLRFSRYSEVKTDEISPGYEPSGFGEWTTSPELHPDRLYWLLSYPSNIYSLVPTVEYNKGYKHTVAGVGEKETWWFSSSIKTFGVDCVPHEDVEDFDFYLPDSSREFPTHVPTINSFHADFPIIFYAEDPTYISTLDKFTDIVISKTSGVRPGDGNASVFSGTITDLNYKASLYQPYFLPNRQLCVKMRRLNDDSSYSEALLGTYYLDEYGRSYRGFNDFEINISGRCLMKYLEEHLYPKNIVLDGFNHKEAMQRVMDNAGLAAYYETKTYFNDDGIEEEYPRLPKDPRGDKGQKLYEFKAYSPIIDLARGVRSYSGWKLFSDYRNKLVYKKVFEKQPRVCFINDINWDWNPLTELDTSVYEGLDYQGVLGINNFNYVEYDVYKTRIFAVGRACESRNINTPDIPGMAPNLDYEYSRGDFIRASYIDADLENKIGDSRIAYFKDLLMGDYQALSQTMYNIIRYMKSGYKTIRFEVSEDDSEYILYNLPNSDYSEEGGDQRPYRPLDLFDLIIVAERGFGHHMYYIKNLRWRINKHTVRLEIEAQYYDSTYALLTS